VTKKKLSTLAEQLSALQLTGSLGTDSTVAGIQREIAKVMRIDPGEPGPAPSEEDPGGHSGKIGEIYKYIRAFVFPEFSRMRSDSLLVLTVVTCGAIGASIAGMRADIYQSQKKDADRSWQKEQQNLALPRIVLGASAGFVAFLALKGGKFLFIIEFSEQEIPINPFSSAFAGIIVGLFTERMYRFVSDLLDRARDSVLGSTN